MSQFINKNTKEVVRILTDENNFYVLNNGTNIDKNLFHQKYSLLPDKSINNIDPNDFLNQPTNPTSVKIVNEQTLNTEISQVDPIDFLNSPTLNTVSGLEDIKKINTQNYIDLPDEQRVKIKDLAKTNTTIEPVNHNIFDRQKMIDDFNRKTKSIQAGEYIDENDDEALDQMINNMKEPKNIKKINENGLTDQEEFIRQQQIELTGEDPYIKKIQKFRSERGMNSQPVNNPKAIDDMEKPIENNTNTVINNNVSRYNEPEDPTTALFRKFKRNHNITINLKIKDKISKPDFIKVMADGLDGDIIQYYTNEIYKSFLTDTNLLKDNIYNQIFKDVYGCLPNDIKDDNDDNIDDMVVNNNRLKKEDVIILIPGKQTKTGERTYKYINDKGKVVDMIPKLAEEKGYKPAIKKIKK